MRKTEILKTDWSFTREGFPEETVRIPHDWAIRIENQRVPGGLLDPEIRITNSDGADSFWKRLYPGGNRDYNYNPDWIRQY